MILVTVELLPGGDAEKRETIATAEIANIGKHEASDVYECLVTSAAAPDLGVAPTSSLFRIYGHRRSAGIIPLLRRVFERAKLATHTREEAAS